MTLPWNKDIMTGIANYRTDFLDSFFNVCSEIGDVPGYILIITVIYAGLNRDLGVRLATLLLLTICVNHLLKTGIMNPRPFVMENTWTQMWAVSKGHMESLVLEYSTPSGHAMSAAAFYGYLALYCGKRWITAVALLAVLLIGASRPYLGVHYVEDILLGWLLGGVMAWLAYRYAAQIVRGWRSISVRAQALALVSFSAGIWVFTYLLDGTAVDQPPLSVIGNLGFLTGVVLAAGLERAHVGFEASYGTYGQKFARCLLIVCFLALPLLGLGLLADMLIERASALGHLAKYSRYALAGFGGLLLAPYLFGRLGLEGKAPEPAEQ